MKKWLSSLIYALILGLLGAVIVHIAIILLVPSYAAQNLWEKIDNLGPAETFHSLDGANWAVRSDPLMRMAACRFDLGNGPLHISAIGKVPFWSMTVYNQNGDITFSLNDQVSAMADMVLLTPVQRLLLEQTETGLVDLTAQSVLITQNLDEGLLVLRVFQPDMTWHDEVTEFLKSAECLPLDRTASQ
jgi:uncharacterized membrane protein